MGVRKHQHGKEHTVCLMPHRIRRRRSVLYLRLPGDYYLFPYLIGRCLFIFPEGILDLLTGGLVIHPVYLSPHLLHLNTFFFRFRLSLPFVSPQKGQSASRLTAFLCRIRRFRRYATSLMVKGKSWYKALLLSAA